MLCWPKGRDRIAENLFSLLRREQLSPDHLSNESGGNGGIGIAKMVLIDATSSSDPTGPDPMKKSGQRDNS